VNKHIIEKIKNFLLELFFPCFCLGCKKEGVYLCEDCRETLEISEFQYCLCNKNPLRLPPTQKKNGKCNRCSAKSLSGLYFALSYKENNLAKKLIYNFKYQPYVKELAKTLSGLLIEHFIITNKNTDDVWENSVLIPIPLDKNKLKRRGYNQSEELAKELSKILQIPVISDILIKTKITKPQMELSKAEREKNIKNAFLIKNPEQIRQLAGSRKKIFLVDDVYTTGSTMEECARVLKEAGAKQIWGIALAREG
jgi:ComF family protein